MDITANGLFVNTDLLDKYEVNYPELGDPVWTWTEFETEMLNRTEPKVKDSAKAAKLLHSDSVLEVRNEPRGRSLK